MRAAGIHTDIAADGAGELRARIGRVEIAVGGNGIGYGKIGDAGLDGCGAVGEIDLQDARHLGKTDDDGILLRNRAAGKRGARPARHDRNAVTMTVFQHRGDLLRGLGKGDRERQTAIGHEGVRLEGNELARLMHETAFRQEIEEIGDDFAAARKNRRARLQKRDLIHISPPQSTSGLFSLPLSIGRCK